MIPPAPRNRQEDHLGALLGRLPRYPGYEWRIAGTDLILIAVGSMIVADILYDVFD
ncbi:hypothetical protein [Pusillimonas noertemannii]|uniref:hypothetical protein n=1 Tax=Pusillimonas noertemannii TaxID=305977 RepID=UPI000313333B|nr:hypothetical protein [Pusillimonas noertemannii]NYT67345.1 hypothetical protein [Pusillimonas noertemannii]